MFGVADGNAVSQSNSMVCARRDGAAHDFKTPRCLWSCLVVVVAVRHSRSPPSSYLQPTQLSVSIDFEERYAGSRTFRGMNDQERIPSSVVARLIGVKTQTLAKWRCFGKGPRGWIRVSSTLVTYPMSEVESYLASLPRDAKH